MPQVPFNLGERVRDPNVRRSVETLASTLAGSRITERVISIPLYDQSPSAVGAVLYEFDEYTSSQNVTSDSYADLTGVSVEVEVPAGAAYVVTVQGGAVMTDTAASDGWLTVWDGTVEYGQMRCTIDANEFHPVTVGWTGEITATTTYTLRARKQAAGTSDYAVERCWLAVTAIPQPGRYGHGRSVWYVPVVTEQAGRVNLKRARIVRGTTMVGNASAYYSVRVGIGQEGRLDYVGTWDGSKRRLDAGVRWDMANQDINRRIGPGSVVMVEVARVGQPEAALEGTTLELVCEVVGE